MATQAKQTYPWQQFYQRNIPDDLGVTSPLGHTMLPDPAPPYLLNLAAGQPGTAPISTNCTADLYASGSENQVLMAASVPQCDTGCIPQTPAGPKPDPRNKKVKPLYNQSMYRGPMYTPYDHPNMYS